MMYVCFDEQMVLHWTQGRVALCGCRSLIEAADNETLDGTERKCRPCEKLKKKECKRLERQTS